MIKFGLECLANCRDDSKNKPYFSGAINAIELNY